MEDKEKAPFEVDLQKLVQDLSNYKKQVEDLTKEKEEIEKERHTYKTNHDTLKVKYDEIEKKNGELYLQVAQSIVGKQEENPQEETVTKVDLNDLVNELNKGI